VSGNDKQPHVVLLAGPNGAGKSTAAPALLRDTLGTTEFVNADSIAQGLSGFDPEQAAIAAGRVMLARLRELARRREDFAFETTLASRSFAPWLEELATQGYAVHLVYLWLPSPALAVERVAQRVRLGGHSVPVETIQRRYAAGLRNFFSLYRPLTTTWQVYMNVSETGPTLLAKGRGNTTDVVVSAEVWESIVTRYG
jgi:predicted ABC-type ATPase